MGKKRTYTITEITRKPSLYQQAVPFDITLNGQVIATVKKEPSNISQLPSSRAFLSFSGSILRFSKGLI